MRILGILAILASLVLGGAAVWMGGLNQDEGWYLYAAQMVADGAVPYRDFFYTQAPVLPLVYSSFVWVWREWGLLGARVLTLCLGGVGILFAVALVRRLVSRDSRLAASLMVFLLLGCNLYHLYYLAIPKTYALASLFAMLGFYLLSLAVEGRRWMAFFAALSLVYAAGTRISLGALPMTVAVFFALRRQGRLLLWFCVGGAIGLALVYAPFVLDGQAFVGLLDAQRYHAARGGSDIVWTVGSLSRLVRWYLPVFVLLGMGVLMRFCSGRRLPWTDAGGMLPLLPWAFLAVFVIQMLAPFPYEDYQVPIMGLLAVYVSAVFAQAPVDSAGLERLKLRVILTLGMTWACSFGSPLLEQWSTNGQDRFWSRKKPVYELPQLRAVAEKINAMDPNGTEILTQDLYLAIETRRRVPKGLEMGPFSMLSDEEWRRLLNSAPCRLAALSGYSFAVNPPSCDERPIDVQMEYWSILKRKYDLSFREENFGQNQTTLMVLERK